MKENITKEKENVIIEAARRRFAHFGFSKVTMDEIAADVDMGKASLYYYFATKESLFKVVLEREQKEFLDEMEIVIAAPFSASEKLIECSKKRLAYFQKLINLSVSGLQATMEPKSIYKDFFFSFEQKELGLINRILTEGKANGEFMEVLEPDFGKILLHILHGLRIRTIKIMKDTETGTQVMEELQHEIVSAVKIFIRGISKQ